MGPKTDARGSVNDIPQAPRRRPGGAASSRGGLPLCLRHAGGRGADPGGRAGGGRHPLRAGEARDGGRRSEEHTSELQSLMRISYAVFCLTKKQKSSKQN